MTSLMLVNSLDCGGLEKQVYTLVRNYPEKFIIVCLNKKGHFGKLLQKQGLKVIELNGNKFKKISQLKKLIKKNNISKIISHNTAPMQLSVLSSLNTDIKRIYVDHNSFAERSDFKINLENRFFSKFIHQFIAVTLDIKEKIIKNWKVKKEKIKVIYNGIDLKDIDFEYNKIKRKKIKICEQLKKSKIVSIIASLRVVKDHPTLLKAFVDINATLLIIGDGPLRNEIKRQISKLGIKNKVKMLGVRYDILRLIDISDVIVCSSLTEGISMTLLEAMALSKPIIASDVLGNKIIVKRNGLLFKPGDYKTLNQHIKRLLSNKDYARKLGSIGRKMIEDYFNVTRMVEEYRKVIDE